MLAVRIAITLLCAVGFYASVFMLRKSIADARGLLREASVVQSPRARIFAGVPNAALGCAYYPALAAVSWLPFRPLQIAALVVAAVAALTSAYLAYSLLFVTRRSCLYCWCSHIVNFLLLLICIIFWT